MTLLVSIFVRTWQQHQNIRKQSKIVWKKKIRENSRNKKSFVSRIQIFFNLLSFKILINEIAIDRFWFVKKSMHSFVCTNRISVFKTLSGSIQTLHSTLGNCARKPFAQRSKGEISFSLLFFEALLRLFPFKKEKQLK